MRERRLREAGDDPWVAVDDDVGKNVGVVEPRVERELGQARAAEPPVDEVVARVDVSVPVHLDSRQR